MKKNLLDHSHDNQLELSYELLYLLAWLCQYEVPALKKIITRAVKHGLKHEYFDIDPAIMDAESQNNIQMSIVDFFAVLEGLLMEAISDENINNVTQADLRPMVEKIDTAACDSETVMHTLEKTTAKMANKPESNPQEILMKELLRRWKPQKKSAMN